MQRFHDFLEKHAKFPFPDTGEIRSAGTTDISEVEASLLGKEWKAMHAVRDDNLFQKLCNTLQNVLGDTPLPTIHADYLLEGFMPRLSVDVLGIEDEEWLLNTSEAQSRKLLDKGFFQAVRKFLGIHGHSFRTLTEASMEGSQSKVDYVALVDGEQKALADAKSPSVMQRVGEILPPFGTKLTWVHGQPLVLKVLLKAALSLGLRKMEWLFLSCHNYWIVCRLVKDADHPFLAYSPSISIEDSSVPFRAFLGAILSVVKDASVEPSEFNRHMPLDTIIEDEDEGPLPENDLDDGSGAYQASSSSGTRTDPPVTCSHHGLMVTSSSPNSPESFQVWIHLNRFSNNTLALPQDKVNKRLWLTCMVGYGSTGNVWKCRFDSGDDLFAAKIVEVLRRSDVDSRKRLRNEFNVYLTLEKTYESGQLRHRIAPRCYGAFKGDNLDVLILDFYDDTLDSWDKRLSSERDQIFQLVQDLHSVGIVHGDLEPRNIVRTREGGFRLIDFTESRHHVCKEETLQQIGHSDPPHSAPVRNQKCQELQTLQNFLWKRQPTQWGNVGGLNRSSARPWAKCIPPQ